MPGIFLAVISGMAKGTEAARVHQIVKHWRHLWEKYQARLRSGLAQVSVDLELDEVATLQAMVEKEYHWGFLTCPEGIQYQVSLDGVWEEIPDPEKFDKITGSFKRSRMMYWRFKPDPKVKGQLVVAKRTVQVSRVLKKDRNNKVKVHKSGPDKGKPIKNERTPFDIIESGFPPYANEALRRLLLRRGRRPDGTPTVAAEKWLLGELQENRKKLREWLIKATEAETLFAEKDEAGRPKKVKRVTTAEIPFVVPHYDSGLLHETFSLYRVGTDLWPCGRPQYGTGGREFVGWDSQVEAGVEMDDWAKAKYEKDLERERDRHGDRGWIDAGLSRRMRAFVKELCAREGCPELWDQCCAEYVDFVERRRELKASLIHARQALAADKKLGALSAKDRDNAVELQTRVVDLRRDLKGTELPGGGRMSEEDYDKLVAEFPLERIAKKIADGVTTIGQLVARLMNSGVKGLVEFLRKLFGTESVTIEAKVEQPAVEVSEVVSDPIAKGRAADAEELAWLEKIKEMRLTYPQAPIGRELEVFIANVGKGVSRGYGLRKSQYEAGLAQVTALGQWVSAEEAPEKTPLATSTPAAQETQDAGFGLPPTVADDVFHVPHFDPANELYLECLAKVKAWRPKSPGDAERWQENEELVAKLYAGGGYGLVSAGGKLRLTAQVTKTENKVKEVLAEKFLHFQAVAKMATRKSVKEAHDHYHGGLERSK
jgi:hypothetical protein